MSAARAWANHLSGKSELTYVVAFLEIPKSTFSVIANNHRSERANADFSFFENGDVDFVQIFKGWKSIGGDDAMMIERIDGFMRAKSSSN